MCASHGGAAPQNKAAAQRRLMEAADPASARLVELLGSGDERIVLGAAKEILDRAGIGEAKRLALEGGVDLAITLNGVNIDDLA